MDELNNNEYEESVSTEIDGSAEGEIVSTEGIETSDRETNVKEDETVVSDNDYSEDVRFASPYEEPKKKKKKGIVGKVLSWAVLAILLGSLAGSAFYGTNMILNKKLGNVDNKKTSTTVTTNKKPNKDKDEDVSKYENQLITPSAGNNTTVSTEPNADGTYSVEAIVENQLPSVVAITNLGVSEVQTMWGTYKQESQSAGSGVVINKTDDELIILTNYHVVSGTKELTVVFSFEEGDEEKANAVPANVKGYDAERDVAVIAIANSAISDDTMARIKVAVVGDSDALKLGEQVVAIGNALGYGQSVTTGIVSALDRYVELDGTEGNKISNYYIQTDAAINPGNSGGALYNMKGELVGINSAKVSNSSVEGMGYAIPMNDIKALVTKLMNMETLVSLKEEEQGYLGVGGKDIDANAAMYGVPTGVYVSAVGKDSSAEKAGIQEKDIINEIAGEEIKSMTEMKKVLSYYRGGEKVEIKIYRFDDEKRSYEEIKVTATLDDYETFKKISEKMQ